MHFSERRRFFKKLAISALYENALGNILSTLLLATVCLGAVYTASLIGELSASFLTEEEASRIVLLIDFVGLLFCFPVVYGYLSRMNGISQKKSLPVSAMFDVFSNAKELALAYRCLLLLTSPLIIVAGVAFLTAMLLGFADLTHIGGMASLLTAVVAILAALALIPMLCKCICAVFVCINGGASVLSGYRQAKTILKGIRLEFVIFNLSFVPWYLASLFTFGIMQIVFVIPYHIISDLVFLRYACMREEIQRDNTGKCPNETNRVNISQEREEI